MAMAHELQPVATHAPVPDLDGGFENVEFDVERKDTPSVAATVKARVDEPVPHSASVTSEEKQLTEQPIAETERDGESRHLGNDDEAATDKNDTDNCTLALNLLAVTVLIMSVLLIVLHAMMGRMSGECATLQEAMDGMRERAARIEDRFQHLIASVDNADEQVNDLFEQVALTKKRVNNTVDAAQQQFAASLAAINIELADTSRMEAAVKLFMAHVDDTTCPARAHSHWARFLSWWYAKSPKLPVEVQRLSLDCTDVHLPHTISLSRSTVLCAGNTWCMRSPDRTIVLFQATNGSLGVINLTRPHAPPRWLWQTPCPHATDVSFYCSWARKPLTVQHTCKLAGSASQLTFGTDNPDGSAHGAIALDDRGQLAVGRCTFDETCV